MHSGLADVREQHRFDVPRLERYLAERIEGFRGPLAVKQFRGGQSNPTYYVNAVGRAFVVRRKPPGKLLPSAHAVDREFRVISALNDTDIPVPRAYLYCDDADVMGTPFYVMDFVPGRIFRNADLDGATRQERRAIYDDLNAVLARLHRLDWKSLGLEGFGRPGNYYSRQIHRWTQQYRASETERIEAMERLIAWLPEHIPPDDETTLVHGDYRPGNVIVHPTRPRVAAVLDWELSTLGHPLADVGYFCLPWHTTKEWEGLQDKDVAELGVPSEREFLDLYCERAGRPPIQQWDFYIGFAMFRLAAIAQGIMGRVIAGTANDPNARERGERARPLAESAWTVIAAHAR